MAGTLELDPDEDPTTVAELWRAWLNAAHAGTAVTRSGGKYREGTIRDYESAMDKHVLPRLGNHSALAVDTAEVQEMLDQLAKAGLSPSRQASAATAIRALFRWASRRRLGARVGDLELPRVPKRTPTILMPGEVTDLLGEVSNKRARAAAAVAVYSGLRAMEIVSLRSSQVNREGCRLTVLKGKTQAAERVVPIPDVLAPYLDLRPRTGPLFTPALPKSAYNQVAHLLQEAWDGRNPRPTLHVLRHNLISWMFAAGVPLPAVQAISGHATPFAPGVTLGVYGHKVGDHVEDARVRLNEWIADQS